MAVRKLLFVKDVITVKQDILKKTRRHKPTSKLKYWLFEGLFLDIAA